MVNYGRDFVPTHLSGIDTHQNPRYALLWARYARKATQTLDYTYLALDPFARACPWAAPQTNDMDPETPAESHLDAIEWVETLTPSATAIGLVDPPFSDRQANEKYGTPNLYCRPGYMSRLQEGVAAAICSGGYIIKCAYNTNSPSPLFELVEVQICHYGGNRNDVLISVWRKSQLTLDHFAM